PADLDVGDLGGRRRRQQGDREDEGEHPAATYHALTSFLTRGSRASPAAPSSASSSGGSAFSFSAGAQKRTRRRTSRMARVRTRPSSDRISRTENWPETSMVKFMLWMSMPSPALAPTNSPTMAPMSAKIIATSRPAITKDREFGSRSIQKICRSLAASERMRLTRSSSAERRPTIVLTRSGKKATSPAFTTLEVRPRPNQITMSGARAILGSDWNMTMYGYRKYST